MPAAPPAASHPGATAGRCGEEHEEGAAVDANRDALPATAWLQTPVRSVRSSGSPGQRPAQPLGPHPLAAPTGQQRDRGAGNGRSCVSPRPARSESSRRAARARRARPSAPAVPRFSSAWSSRPPCAQRWSHAAPPARRRRGERLVEIGELLVRPTARRRSSPSHARTSGRMESRSPTTAAGLTPMRARWLAPPSAATTSSAPAHRSGPAARSSAAGRWRPPRSCPNATLPRLLPEAVMSTHAQRGGPRGGPPAPPLPCCARHRSRRAPWLTKATRRQTMAVGDEVASSGRTATSRTSPARRCARRAPAPRARASSTCSAAARCRCCGRSPPERSSRWRFVWSATTACRSPGATGTSTASTTSPTCAPRAPARPAEAPSGASAALT